MSSVWNTHSTPSGTDIMSLKSPFIQWWNFPVNMVILTVFTVCISFIAVSQIHRVLASWLDDYLPAFINEHVNWPVSVDLIGTNIILRFFIFDALGSLNKAVFVTQYFSLPAVVPWPPVAVATLCHNCLGLARVYLCQCLESLSITLYAAIFLRFPFPELKCSRTFNNAVIIVLLFKLSLRQWWHMVGFLSSNMYIVTPHLMQTADRRIAQN